MINADELVSLRKHQKDDDAIHTILETGIKEKIKIYIHYADDFMELSPEHIQRIRSFHPGKVEITLGYKRVLSTNEWMGTSSVQEIPLKRVVTVIDLWVLENDLNILFKKPAIKHSAISENERNTMLRMILGMAMGAYGYKPNADRNPATGSNKGSIKFDLERNGFPIHEDTVRKYLDEAVKTFVNHKP